MSSYRRFGVIAAVLGALWVVWLLTPILTPFLLGAAIAYLLDPVVERLVSRGWSRNRAVTLVLVMIGLVGLIAAGVLVPLVLHQLDYLVQRFPALLLWLKQDLSPWLEARFGIGLSTSLLDAEGIRAWLAGHWRESAATLAGLLRSGADLLGLLASLAITPVVMAYLLLDWPVLVSRVRELVPRPHEEMVVRLAGECDRLLSAFVRGQLLVMIALALVYAIGLSIVGLKSGLLVGLLAGLGSIIPYLGVVVGLVSATVAVLFQSGFDVSLLLAVATVFAIGQLLEGWVFTPYFIGDRIGLHPVAVIFAVLAGGQLFGFAGMLLALPGAAVLLVLLRHAKGQYLESTLYRGAGSEHRDA